MEIERKNGLRNSVLENLFDIHVVSSVLQLYGNILQKFINDSAQESI